MSLGRQIARGLQWSAHDDTTSAHPAARAVDFTLERLVHRRGTDDGRGSQLAADTGPLADGVWNSPMPAWAEKNPMLLEHAPMVWIRQCPANPES